MSDSYENLPEIHGFSEQISGIMESLPVALSEFDLKCDLPDSPEEHCIARYVELHYHRIVVIQGILKHMIVLLCNLFKVPINLVHVSIMDLGEKIELQFRDTRFCTILLEISTKHEMAQYSRVKCEPHATKYIFISILILRANFGREIEGTLLPDGSSVHLIQILENFMADENFESMRKSIKDAIESYSGYYIPFP